jgi:hypothetical protein
MMCWRRGSVQGQRQIFAAHRARERGLVHAISHIERLLEHVPAQTMKPGCWMSPLAS